MKPRLKLGRAAFTLVELLVSITILSALLLIVYTIFSQTSKVWTLAEARTETFQAARLALEMVSRDLSGAIAGTNSLPSSPGKAITYLTVENANNSPSLATGDSDILDTPPNDQLFFVAAASDTVKERYSDITEFGYFVAFATTNKWTMAGPGYYLLRHQLRCFTSSGSASAGYDVFSQPTTWYTTPSIGYDSKLPLVDNVLRLELRYERPGGTAPQGTCVLDDWNAALGSCPAGSIYTLPRAVHITMCVLDRRYATRAYAIIGSGGLYPDDLAKLPDNIESIPDFAYGGRGAALRNIFREGLRTFYRTVYLNNAQ